MTTSRAPRPTKIAAALLATTLGLLTACGASTDNPAGNESTTTGESSTPSEAATKPATLARAVLQVPADWEIEIQDNGLSMSAPGRDGHTSPGHANFHSSPFPYAEPDANKTLATDYERTLKRMSGQENLKRLPDLKVDGATFYHFQTETEATWQDWYGTIHNDTMVKVNWTFYSGSVDRKEATELINQVMPTFKSS